MTAKFTRRDYYAIAEMTADIVLNVMPDRYDYTLLACKVEDHCRKNAGIDRNGNRNFKQPVFRQYLTDLIDYAEGTTNPRVRPIVRKAGIVKRSRSRTQPVRQFTGADDEPRFYG